MDTDSIAQIIIIIILLFLSAFFSSAETAFTTVNRIKIRTLSEEGNKRAGVVEKIINNSGKMISTILIGNNIVNLSASTLVTTVVIKLFGNHATGIATGVLTLIILIFGEISPKTAASLNAEKLTIAYAPIIQFLMFILSPVIYIVENLSGIFLKLFNIDKNTGRKSITEAELRTIVSVSHEDGVIESDEKKIINNLFDFGDSEAKDVMIPRIDMSAIDINSTYADVLKLYKETLYSRFPVFDNNPDNITGILNIKDIIAYSENSVFNIKDIMRPAFFTYEHKNTSELFKEMNKGSHSIAIILDEYGICVGMITTEDLLEEIVGEIRDEYDEDETDSFIKLTNNIYKVDASYKLDDINKAIGSSLYSEDNDTIGGYIIEKMDGFPKNGDHIIVDNIEFIIEHVTKARIDSIIMKVKPDK